MAATIPGTTLDPVEVRLHRIEGQTHALTRMYDAGRPTTDLLDLIAAVRAALGGLGLALITQEGASPDVQVRTCSRRTATNSRSC